MRGYIGECIKSVVGELYGNIEYVIVDGCSTDNTLDIIRQYEDRIAYWRSEPDRGIFDAMNKGAGLTSGDWNFLAPHRLACYSRAGDMT